MLGLRTTIYKVADLAKAKDWYASAYNTQPYFDQPFYVGFNIGGYELGLDPDDSTGIKSDNAVAYWGVDHIQKEYDRLIQLGASEHGKPTNVGGEIMVATVKDPWGNIIGLIYNPDFKIQ
jgi:predicted enzyme related to lactoylglutathione lyase